MGANGEVGDHKLTLRHTTTQRLPREWPDRFSHQQLAHTLVFPAMNSAPSASGQLGEEQGAIIRKAHAPTRTGSRVKPRLKAAGRTPAAGDANNPISPRVTPGLPQQGRAISIAS